MKRFKLGLQVRHVLGAWMCTLTLAAGWLDFLVSTTDTFAGTSGSAV